MLKIGGQSCSKTNARDNFLLHTFYSSYKNISSWNSSVLFVLIFPCSNQLCLWNRDLCLWKQYKKYPTFPFFYLINCLPLKMYWKELKQESKRLKYGAHYFNGLLKSSMMAFFGCNIFRKFLGTRLTLSNGQRKQVFNKFNKKLLELCLLVGDEGLAKDLQC